MDCAAPPMSAAAVIRTTVVLRAFERFMFSSFVMVLCGLRKYRLLQSNARARACWTAISDSDGLCALQLLILGRGDVGYIALARQAVRSLFRGAEAHDRWRLIIEMSIVVFAAHQGGAHFGRTRTNVAAMSGHISRHDADAPLVGPVGLRRVHGVRMMHRHLA